MTARTDALATTFEQALADLIATIEASSETQWRAICGDERWTVAATAQHVGAQFGIERELINGTAGLAPMPPATWDEINEANERRAQQFSACSKEEAIALLKQDGPKMAELVRGLTDEQLDRAVPFPLAGGASVTTQQIIEGGVLIDHVRGHLGSIRAAG